MSDKTYAQFKESARYVDRPGIPDTYEPLGISLFELYRG